MADLLKGKITQVIGAVVDIKFENGVPRINASVRIKTDEGNTLTCEVAQDLGDNTVKCISMGSTDGLKRGMEAESSNEPISVPVGEGTLGRIFNVLGNTIDGKGDVKATKYYPIHRPAPKLEEQSTDKQILVHTLKIIRYQPNHHNLAKRQSTCHCYHLMHILPVDSPLIKLSSIVTAQQIHLLHFTLLDSLHRCMLGHFVCIIQVCRINVHLPSNHTILFSQFPKSLQSNCRNTIKFFCFSN